ncbi:MAG: hypothetical protein BRD53_04180 [Bacteroidetes bacterium SW_7_64_58]|nr:MAG: hypothetical protein BRD53_04180 [Bacteroidetes bacterium SW_7_64_58]
MTRGCIAQASSTSMTILEPSGEGPKEERYVSTNQIRRPLQAVCSNIAEAWSNPRTRERSRHRREQRSPQ